MLTLISHSDIPMYHPLPFQSRSQPITGPPTCAEDARYIEAMRRLCGVKFGVSEECATRDTAAYNRSEESIG